MTIISLILFLISFFWFRSKSKSEKESWKDLFSAISMKVTDFYCKGTPTKIVMGFLKLEMILFEAIAFGMPIIRAAITKGDKGFWQLFCEFQFDGISVETAKWFLYIAAGVVVLYLFTYRNEDKIVSLFEKIQSSLKDLKIGQKEIKNKVDRNSDKLDAILNNGFRDRISPIITLREYASIYQNHGVRKPEDNESLKKKRALIVNPNSSHVRILALSGTGKTYQILKSFEEAGQLDSIYYCDSVNHADFYKALQNLVLDAKDCTLILDNCKSSIAEAVIREYGNSIRVITAHYDPNDSANGYKEIDLNAETLESIISDIIDTNANDGMPEDQKQFIKRHCGGIPLMALLLTQAYNTSGKFSDIHDIKLLNNLLNLDSDNEAIQRVAMRTIALFQPLDFAEGESKTADYLMNSDKFTSYLTQVNRKEIFKTIVRKLYKRNLIEKDSVFINMRPQPLACWLVAEWLKDKGEAIVETISDLSAQPRELSSPLIEAWAKRLEFMQGNKDAEDLYAELVKLNGGPFANEDVVCSDFGSRLILAMATVNPVAISECLFGILFNKPVEWLKDTLVGDARRNIVRTLEKLCFCGQTFHQSAHTLARLAISENEDWSNNSEGQFRQLFHIALAGTECDLTYRYEVIKALYHEGREYHELLLTAIRGAYAHQNLHRIGGPEKFGFIELKDYTPTWNEIDEYWANIWSLLVEWMDEHPEDVGSLSGIVVQNSRMLVRAGHASTLFDYIAYIANKLDNRWNAMHKALVEIKNYDVMSPKDGDDLLHWIEVLTPKDIVGQMRNAVHDLYSMVHKGSDALGQEESVVLPYVAEFVSTKGYLTEEIHDVISNNKDYLSWAFTKNLALQIPSEDLPLFWDYVMDFIRLHENEFYSQFLVRFVSELPDSKQAYSFIKSLYNEGYLRLSISLMGVSDDSLHYWLGVCFDEIHAGNLDASYISYYMNVIRIRETESILSMGKFIKEHGADDRLLFGHYATYWYLDELYKDANCMTEYKSAILNYPLDAKELYNQEFNLAVRTLLEKHRDNEFVKALNRKLIEYLSNNQSYYHVEDLYKVLLTDYYDVIWPDFAKAFTDIDNHAAFYFNVHYAVGAGFDFDEKCLYAGHYDEMKQLCKDYEYGAWACAGTCPVFAESEDGLVKSFHPFAIWLIENYGGKEHVIEEFSANMGTFHWAGSAIPLYEDQKQCLNDLLQNHTIDEKVKAWAEQRLKVVNCDTERERQNDAYMRMAYGKQ